jgi:hypothetical protein
VTQVQNAACMIGYDVPGVTSATYTQQIASGDNVHTVFTGSNDGIELWEIAA